MATVTVVHASVTGAAANPAVLVDGPKWDAAHSVSGLENVVNVDSTNASNLTSGTVPAARMPALTGDITTVAGAVATTLATVNGNIGSFGSATQSVTVTFNAKGLATAASASTITPAVGSVTGLGTGVATALGVNVGSAGAFVTFNGALGSPSSAGTIPAYTLGGTIAGGGNQINNVIIGTSTPLAGSFTTLGSGVHTVTSASAAALAVGLNGATNPTFNVDDSTASQVAGISVKGAITGGTVAVNVTDSGTNANLDIEAKGTGTISLNTTATGAIFVGSGGTTASVNGLIVLNGSSGSNGGASAQFRRNSTPLFSFGNSSGILGGASNDFVVYSHTSGAGTTPSINVSDATGAPTFPFGFGTAPPVTKTADYTVLATDSSIICNKASTLTLTLLAAATYPGRHLLVKTIQAQTVVSASSNVAPRTDSALGTAILPATDGAWALLQSDGTGWVIMAGTP